MKIVNTDNFGRDYPDERFVENIPPLTIEQARLMCDILNDAAHSAHGGSRYYMPVDMDYKLKPGFEP